MSKQRIYLLAAVMLMLMSSLAFYAGKRIGAAKAFEWFAAETEKSNAEVALGRYVASRDTAKNLKHGDIARAKCSADLVASADLDAMKECIAKPSCRANLGARITALAPELGAPSVEATFDYVATRNGRKECSQY